MAGTPINMRQKLAWLCGTGVFALLICTSVFRQIDIMNVVEGNSSALEPISAMLLSLLGGVAGGALGYMMGDILSRPKGNRNPRKGRKKGKAGGSETFLDDLGKPSDLPDITKEAAEAATAKPLASYDTPAAAKAPEQQPSP